MADLGLGGAIWRVWRHGIVFGSERFAWGLIDLFEWGRWFLVGATIALDGHVELEVHLFVLLGGVEERVAGLAEGELQIFGGLLVDVLESCEGLQQLIGRYAIEQLLLSSLPHFIIKIQLQSIPLSLSLTELSSTPPPFHYYNSITQQLFMLAHSTLNTLSDGPLLQIRRQTFSILRKNQEMLWKHFTRAVILHVENQLAQAPVPATHLTEWLPNKIQSFVKWIQDPASKRESEALKKRQEFWEKQRKQWERTFELLLHEQASIRRSHQCDRMDRDHKIKQLQNQVSSLSAKCSALASQKQILTSLFNSYFQRINTQQLSLRQSIGHCKTPSSAQTVASTRQDPTNTVSAPISQFSTQTPKIRRRLTKICEYSLCLCYAQSWSQNNTKPEFRFKVENTVSIALKNNREQRQIGIQNVSEIRSQETMCDDVEESFSSEQEVMLSDKCTQTIANKQDAQQALIIQKQSIQKQARLVRKIMQLEIQIDTQDKQIKQKQIQIHNQTNAYQKMMKINNQTISQLQQDLAISNKLQEHACEQLREWKQKYSQGEAAYRSMREDFKRFAQQVQASREFPNLTNAETITDNIENQCQRCIELEALLCKQCSTTQTELSERSSEQLTTPEPEEDAVADTKSEDTVNRLAISRYLIDFLNFEVNGGPAEKKISAIATAVQVLGLCESHHSLVVQYSKRVMRQVAQTDEKQQLQNKLFKYLTEQ